MRTRIPITLALSVLLWCAHSHALHAQRTAAPEEVMTADEDTAAMVPAYRYIVRSDRKEFNYTDLSGGPIVDELDRTGNIAFNYCAPRDLKKAELRVKLDRGEDYEYGGTGPFDADFDVTIIGRSANNLIATQHSFTLKINVVGPEQVFYARFDEANGELASYLNVAKFEINVTPLLITPTVTQDLRLTVSYKEEYAIGPKDIGNPSSPLVTIVPLRPVNGITKTNPVRFQWDIQAGCADTFPNYQFQLLRLYNTDTSSAYANSVTKAKGVVDWSQALTLETGSGKRELKLTIAEGSGYYLWRVRPIGSQHDGGVANDRNWGVWSDAPANGATFDYTSPSSQDLHVAAFYYRQFDNDKNWTYNRAFTEGLRISEAIAYATTLQQPRQTQVRVRSRDSILVEQTIYDHAGRAAMQSLAAPIDSGDIGYFGYLDTVAAVNKKLYRPNHFDDDSTLRNPNAFDGGLINEYYSDANKDKTIPNAEGYPFSRTLFSSDGTNRPKEVGDVGAALRIGGSGAGKERTTKVYYSGVSNWELIKLFGDEAPSDTSVHKILTTSPNKVTTVQYISKEGQVIATAVETPPGDTLQTKLNEDNGHLYVTLVNDTIVGDRKPGTYRLTSNKRLAFTDTTNLWLRYTITPDILKETVCADLCTTCDYVVLLIVHDLENPDSTRTIRLVIGAEACNGVEPREIDTMLRVPPGTYVIERRVETNNIDSTTVTETNPFGTTYAESYRANVLAQLRAKIWSNATLAKVKYFLDKRDIDSLYDYLDVNPAVDTIKLVSDGCCLVRIPIIEPDCGFNACLSGVPDFEQYLIDKWWQTFANENDKNNLNKYFRTRGGDDQYKNAPGTYPNGKGAFNKLIENMLAEQHNNAPVYSCKNLWLCWSSLVDSYLHLATTDGNPANPNKDFSLFDAFLDCAGRRIVDTARLAWDANRSYLLHAYKYINYTVGTNGNCETHAGYMATWHNNTDAIGGWDSLYQCLRSGWTKDHPSEAGEEFSNCFTEAGNDPDDRDECLEQMKEAIEGACKERCDARRDEFLNNIFQAYAKAGQTISWDHALCAAEALVDSCQLLCSLSVHRDGNGHIDTLGRQADYDRMDTVYRYDLQLTYKGQGSCPDSSRLYQGWKKDYKELIPEFLNEKLKVYRRDSIGANGGYWNFKRALREEMDLPTSLLDKITDSLVFVYATDTSDRFEINANCELWYKSDTVFYGTTADPHPLVDHLNLLLDTFWGYEVDNLDGNHDEVCYSGAEDVTTRRYLYADDRLPDGYAELRDELLSATFSNINGGTSERPLSDFIIMGKDDWIYSDRDSVWAFKVGDDPFKMGFVQIEGKDGGLAMFKLIAMSRLLPSIPHELHEVDYHCRRRGCDYGHWYDRNDIPKSLVADYFRNPYTQTIGKFIEDANHYVVYVSHCDQNVTGGVDVNSTASRLFCGIRFFTTRTEKLGTNMCLLLECPPICYRWVNPDTAMGPVDTLRPTLCSETAIDKIYEAINRQIAAQTEARLGEMQTKYISTCANADSIDDELIVRYPLDYYHFTLYYYDRAGNLVKTVAPKGVDRSANDRVTHPAHGFINKFEYNSLGQPTWERTPDQGETQVWYDGKGRLRFSQNAQQKIDGAFSYLKYDGLDRVIETGKGSGGPAQLDANVEVATYPATGSERVYTVYTTPANITYLDGTPQHYLRNRISYTYTDEGSKTYYSYDVHGNIEWVAHYIPGFEYPPGTIRTNYVKYSYDLISGNVIGVAYNEGRVDQFHHRYENDADGRLALVETSRDGEIWDCDARYGYYPTGMLQRMELGEDKVQGLDYIYTAQGWLKAINHPSLKSTDDPGNDGTASNKFAADSFAIELGYFNGDFKRTGSPYDAGVSTALKGTPLFDGTISSATSHIGHQTDHTMTNLHGDSLTGETYRYDLLNRIDSSTFYTYDDASGQWTKENRYGTSYEYDPNGNIDTLRRNAYNVNGTPLMDDQTFNYVAGSNKLNNVDEAPAAIAGRFIDDLDDQAPNSFTYDANGNPKKNLGENLTSITWNNDARIQSTVETLPGGPLVSITLTNTYNSDGQRVKKEVRRVFNNGQPTEVERTFYVHEAGGLIVAIYEQICLEPESAPDGDGDGIPDNKDNCPLTSNPLQTDIDLDGLGDACDNDIDNDLVLNPSDNCPLVANPAPQTMVCAGDQDGDGLLDESDPCPQVPNSPTAPDGDRDGVPDPCDADYIRTKINGYGEGPACPPRLAELPIYGLKRVGSVKPNLSLSDTVPTQIFTRTMHQKEYELHDHLGNVRVVTSDEKQSEIVAGVPTNFHADIRSYSNFYPFGMEQPGRTVTGVTRWGYNGMEKDGTMPGASGTHYATYFREYDTRLGRWWSTDPVMHPWESAYAGMANNPVMYVDPFGAEPDGGGAVDPDSDEEWERTGRLIIVTADRIYPPKEESSWLGDIWNGVKSAAISTVDFVANNLDHIQTGIDIIGLIPVIGEPADLLNAGIYYLRGDNVSAALSVAAAAPVIGATATGVKLANKGATTTARITGYTRHGLNQAISREGKGVSVRAIKDAVTSPTKVVKQADGSTRYIGKDARVVLNSEGKVVTTIPRNRDGVRIKK